jgi:hypothetical protein
MNNQQRSFCNIIFFFLLIITISSKARSPHRPVEQFIPCLSVQWQGSNTIYTNKSFYYEEYPIFHVFDSDYFNSHQLPQSPISYQKQKLVNGAILNNLIEQVLTEIQKKKKRYTHFNVLQHKNFNRRKKCGLLVLKFKDYPFVVKLFIETPKTFVNPYCKGFEPRFFFTMAGGVNRHISGITRIKNLELLNYTIKNNKNWQGRVKTPRKWFWTPKNNKLLHITGKNIGNKEQLITAIPGTYAIIADAINTDEEIKMPQKKRNEIIMQLCNDLELIIDPHSNNFIFKYDEKNNNFFIVIIDTEHFPTIVGLKEKKKFKSHYSWYLYLAGKCFHDTFLLTKQQRCTLQTTPRTYISEMLVS